MRSCESEVQEVVTLAVREGDALGDKRLGVEERHTLRVLGRDVGSVQSGVVGVFTAVRRRLGRRTGAHIAAARGIIELVGVEMSV